MDAMPRARNGSERKPEGVKNMRNKALTLLILATMALALSLLRQPSLNAYGEQGGGWTASEKRQVISLLEKIEENTRN